MVLSAEEHSQNTHHFFRLINIEIEYRLMFCYPAKAGQPVGNNVPWKGAVPSDFMSPQSR